MKSAIMIRKTGPISVNKLPDRSDSEIRYHAAMERGSKALLQAIFETGKIHGFMTREQEIEAISWAYNVDVTLS